MVSENSYCLGDVYLVGCTNVGKSSLFNALLQSDYCKTKAVDLMQRATTAPWPGTTLNLLKVELIHYYSVETISLVNTHFSVELFKQILMYNYLWAAHMS